MELVFLVIAIPLLILVAPRILRYLKSVPNLLVLITSPTITFKHHLKLVSVLIKFRKRSEKSALQLQAVEYRKELAKISQVDEFAKYSKIQRKLRTISDQLNSIARQDLELNVKYVLFAQAIAWLFAVIFCFKLIYQIYSIALFYMGWSRLNDEKFQY